MHTLACVFMQVDPATCSASLHRNPFVPVAAVFLGGVAMGDWLAAPVALLLILIAVCLAAWVFAEIRRRILVTHITLGLAILLSGVCVYRLNQYAVEPTHIARYLSDRPVPITSRIRILAPPENIASHGNVYSIASITEIFGGNGWVPADGDVRVRTKISSQTHELRRGQVFEIYGWLQRPESARNPGSYDLRQALAADRIFAEIRVPRVVGMQLLDDSDAASQPLSQFRGFLRAHAADTHASERNTGRLHIGSGQFKVFHLFSSCQFNRRRATARVAPTDGARNARRYVNSFIASTAIHAAVWVS